MRLGQNLMMAAGAGGGELPPYSIDTQGTDGGLAISSVTGSDFGTGDFTYEAWIYAILSTANYGAVLGHTYSNGGGLVYLRSANSITYYEGTSLINVGSVTDATWTHVAVVRDSGVLTVYIDGVSAGSVTYTRIVSDTNLYVGSNQNTNEEFQGYIWRPHVLNVAKYTGNFAPVKNYGLESGSLMLIEADAAGFTDLAGNTITNNGAVVVEAAP